MNDSPLAAGARTRDEGAAAPVLPDHLVPFPDSSWAYWKRVLVRSTGFPAALVLRLAEPPLAGAADRLNAAHDGWASACEAALDRVSGALDRLRESGGWDDDARRKPLVKAQRALRKGKLTRPVEELAESAGDPEIRAAVERLAAAGEELDAAGEELQEVHAEALEAQSRTIHELAGDERFREAVLWQNRAGYEEAVGKLLEQEPDDQDRNKWLRRREELVASYLQRYCLKNDTIGFFGPSSLGILRTDRDGDNGVLAVRPGSGLLAERKVFLEDWALDELASELASDPGVRRWLRPRRLPHVVLRDGKLYLPGRPPTELEPAAAAVLANCDGSHRAREMTTVLAGVEAAPDGEGELLRILEELSERGLVAWGFEVPIGPHAEAVLEEQVAAIGDSGVRERCRDRLGELARGREAVARAAGRPEALADALSELEATFTRLTGTPAVRKPGETYGGRTLIYEEARRDLDLEVGHRLHRQLAAPLSLVLTSARWFLLATAQLVRQRFRDIHRRLAEEVGRPAVPCGLVWRELQPLLFGERQETFRELLPDLQERWQRILGIDPGADGSGRRRIELTSGELRSRVEEAFAIPADAAGWPMARLHSPDVLIAARDVEAIRRGEHRFVLGELHVGKNTFNAWSFMAVCPERDEVFRCMDLDIPEPQVIPLPPKDNPRLTTRTHKAHLSPKDYFVPPLDGAVVVPPERAVSFADAVLTEEDGEMVVRAQGGSLVLDPLVFFGDFVMFQLSNFFELLPPGPHRPRVTLDRLVIQRETWRFAADELEMAEISDAAERFAAVRRWAEHHGLPRFMFLRTPQAEKPFYADLQSPILVDLLAKAVRDARQLEDGWVEVSEMLPSPDEVWLEDAEGQRYACELRMVCRDLEI